MQLSWQPQLIAALEPNRKLFLPPILPRNKKPTKSIEMKPQNWLFNVY
jgi:hypothetical protein